MRVAGSPAPDGTPPLLVQTLGSDCEFGDATPACRCHSVITLPAHSRKRASERTRCVT